MLPGDRSVDQWLAMVIEARRVTPGRTVRRKTSRVPRDDSSTETSNLTNGVGHNPVERDWPLAVGTAAMTRAFGSQDTVSLGQRVDLRSQGLDGAASAMQEKDRLAGSNVLVVTGDPVDLAHWHGGILSLSRHDVGRRMPAEHPPSQKRSRPFGHAASRTRAPTCELGTGRCIPGKLAGRWQNRRSTYWV
jgi:hypothetical protein